MKKFVEIDGRKIGREYEPYIICELSANHNGSLSSMMEMIDAAAETGCDAIKIQSYTADTMTIRSDRPDFQITGGPWDGRDLYSLYEEAGTPFEWHEAIFERAKKRGVTIFSSPFDNSSVDLLEGLGAPAYKIASFELVDLPLIRYVASKNKPMIMSTGLGNLAEIEAAVAAARGAGCNDLILLHCISSYPAPVEQSNLRTIAHLGEAFDVVAGLSDHSLSNAVSVASIALGGSVIEKHFTLSRDAGGPDSGFSLEPEEFSRLCIECKDAWKALGQVGYSLKGAETANANFRRSIYVVSDIAAGTKFTAENVRCIRPGYGLAPKHLDAVMGQSASRDIVRGEPLSWDLVEH